MRVTEARILVEQAADGRPKVGEGIAAVAVDAEYEEPPAVEDAIEFVQAQAALRETIFSPVKLCDESLWSDAARSQPVVAALRGLEGEAAAAREAA